jgi:transposase
MKVIFFSLEMDIKILLQYQEHLSKLDAEKDALAKEIEEYQIIQSIPGTGEKIVSTTISDRDSHSSTCLF